MTCDTPRPDNPSCGDRDPTSLTCQSGCPDLQTQPEITSLWICAVIHGSGTKPPLWQFCRLEDFLPGAIVCNEHTRPVIAGYKHQMPLAKVTFELQIRNEKQERTFISQNLQISRVYQEY